MGDDELTATIVREIKNSHFYGIQADEVMDVSGREQLGISVRYEKEGEAVEILIAFVECKSVTGSAISSKILSELQRVGLDPKRCRAQTYDGAGSLSGHLNGCQAKFRVVPEARYYHCATHQLNLALTKACAVTSVQCMLSDLHALGIFFKYSPKRQRCLQTCTTVLNRDRKQNGKSEICSLKLKLLSATRWVERHTAISDFIKIYEAIIYCLEVICGQSPFPSIDQQSLQCVRFWLLEGPQCSSTRISLGYPRGLFRDFEHCATPPRAQGKGCGHISQHTRFHLLDD